ncbi:hypothetical protein F2Q65_17790 [Thiohalocapsa marina]|uniref:Uncharacterized protein n=1 Tax=Thiohalocapsa marina TaxID=424902 RepID=A0A5M8FNL9_9GAMM|nr:hypothetical protein [Thiohalocapsa marina]KAA6182522.1 hypothetical protein F2Q65_17790 [Thiohalocapsa marina]
MFSKTLLRGLFMCAIAALCSIPAMAQTFDQNIGSRERPIGIRWWQRHLRDPSVEKFIARLEEDGIIVTKGDPIKFDPIGKFCDGNYPNALYANYGAPYTAAALGPSPRAIGGLPEEVKEVALELPIIRLAPDEAVVLVGMTPPPEAYFSYQIYLATRWYTNETEPGKNRIELLLNSLGDTVNMQTIKTIGLKPFERPMVFIYTADRGIDARVRAALRRAGYPAQIINTIVIPSATLKLGFESDSDTFLIANRNALWVDPLAGEAYVENPTYQVFRLTPEPEAVLNPFPAPPLRTRGTGQTEIDLTPALARLRAAIIQQYAIFGCTAKEYVTKTVAYEGYDFTQRKVTTLGDTRDALYLGAGTLPEFDLDDEMMLTEGEFLIAYGLNHMATGKATYVNLNAYTSGPSKMALGSAFPDDLEGSAYQYLSWDDPDSELTYAYKISRDCRIDEETNEPFCLQLAVPVAGCTNKDGSEILTDTSPLGVIFRLYLEPPTSIGAACPEVVYDQVIKFTCAQGTGA